MPLSKKQMINANRLWAHIAGTNVEIHIKTSLFGFFFRVCIRCAFEATYEKYNLNSC